MSVTVSAPDGAHFASEEVRTKAGTESLGEVPLLVWDDAAKAVTFYGDEGIKSILDGTSLRVAFQSIARRGKAKKLTDDQIAQQMVDYRPGTRAVGVSTPASRARTAAAKAVDKGVDADKLNELLEKVAKGEISVDDALQLA